MSDKKYRTQPEIVDMMRRVGFGPRPARIASAIALCETPVLGSDEPTSNFGLIGDLHLVDEKWGPSIGGFQIRSLKSQTGTGEYRDANELIKPMFNCKAARHVYIAQGWSAWTTYTSGMYKAYLQDLFPPPPNTHVVLAGETLGSIAPKYDLSWQTMARMNNLHEPYSIYIGQYLRYVDD